MTVKNASRLCILTLLKPKTNFPNLILLELVAYFVDLFGYFVRLVLFFLFFFLVFSFSDQHAPSRCCCVIQALNFYSFVCNYKYDLHDNGEVDPLESFL